MAKLKAREVSEEVRALYSSRKKGENNPMFGRTGINHPMYGKAKPEGETYSKNRSLGCFN